MIKIPWAAINGLTAVLSIAAVGAGTMYAGKAVSRNDLIGEEAAEEFAILDAGIHEDETSRMHTKLERDHGDYVYEIEFYVDDVKYEYEILARDGTIREKDIEKKQDENGQGGQNAQPAPEKTETVKNEDPAPAEKTQAEQSETPDEQAEAADAKPAQTTPESAPVEEPVERKIGYISVNQAKEIALEHANLTEEDVRFTTAKFEDDNSEGPQYEVEFYSGSTEYEYEIDALTGEIQDYDIDYDD